MSNEDITYGAIANVSYLPVGRQVSLNLTPTPIATQSKLNTQLVWGFNSQTLHNRIERAMVYGALRRKPSAH